MPIYWLEQSMADVPHGDEWLCENECARMASIRFPKRRADWRLGRWTAKLAIAEYLDAPAVFRTLSRIEIGVAASGAPRALLGSSAAGIAISITHSNGTAACSVSDASLTFGCDLETIEARSDFFVSDYFTVEERAILAEVDSVCRTQVVNLIWSAKESTLKALEEGLRLDTRAINISLESFRPHQEGNWRPLLARIEGARFFKGWYRSSGRFVRTLVGFPDPEIPMIVHSQHRLATTS